MYCCYWHMFHTQYAVHTQSFSHDDGPNPIKHNSTLAQFFWSDHSNFHLTASCISIQFRPNIQHQNLWAAVMRLPLHPVIWSELSVNPCICSHLALRFQFCLSNIFSSLPEGPRFSVSTLAPQWRSSAFHNPRSADWAAKCSRKVQNPDHRQDLHRDSVWKTVEYLPKKSGI